MSQEPSPNLGAAVSRLDSALLVLLLICSGLAVIFLLAARGASLGAVTPTLSPTTIALALSPSPVTPTLTPSPARTGTLPPVPTPRVGPLALNALYAGVPFTLDGQAVPGQTIAVFDNDVLLGQWLAGSDGHWSIDVPAGLPVGEHRLVVVAIGLDGRRSEAVPVGFTVIHAPATHEATQAGGAAIIGSVTATQMESGPETAAGPDAAAALATKQAGASAEPADTLAGTPVALPPSTSPTSPRAVGGPLQTQSSAAVIQQAASLTPAPVREASPTPARPRPTATGQGEAVSQSAASPTPATPLGASPSPDAALALEARPTATPTGAAPSGAASPNGVQMPLLAVDPQVASQDETLIFSGQGEPGGTVTLLGDNGALLGTAPVGPDGRWTVEADPAAVEGVGQVTAQLFDPAGIIVAQATRPQTSAAPRLPVTGQAAATPRASGPALVLLLGLALLTGGLVLRQAGRILTAAAPMPPHNKKGTRR